MIALLVVVTLSHSGVRNASGNYVSKRCVNESERERDVGKRRRERESERESEGER